MRVVAIPQGLRPSAVSRRTLPCLRALKTSKVEAAEKSVLKAMQTVTGRGKEGMSEEQQARLEEAVALLEADHGVLEPTKSDLLDGRWKLLYTSRPGTASPIQRTFTGVEAFTIFQEVLLRDKTCRVNNVVEFGENAKIGTLKVEALASTDSRPMEGFTPRAGKGLALFGKSQTGPAARPHMRVDFQFDQAAFDFRKLPFKIPYPVPFRQLGDETKGWIDITYMNPSGTFRLTRGNKGTLFILVKPETTKVDDLLVAVREKDDDRVMKLALQLKGTASEAAPAQSPIIQGRWRLVWSAQAKKANPLQKALIGFTRSWQIIGSDSEGRGQLENLVDLGLVKVSAMATCSPSSGTKSAVMLTTAEVKVLGQSISLPGVVESADKDGFVEWMYVDENVRVSRGNKGSTFVHVREKQ